MSLEATHAQYAQIRAAIEHHGHATVYNGSLGANGPHGYTVGLAAHGLPELIVFGLNPTTTENVLNALAARMHTHGAPDPGDLVVGILAAGTIAVLPVADTATHLPIANRFYRLAEPIEALQVVYADTDGRFPWHPGSLLVGMPLLCPPPQRT